jgi:hypothetical protein
MIIKNPEKVVGVVDKWIALLQPISAKVVGTSKVEMATRANVNPFATYYQQLQTYKALLENKSMMSTGSASSLISGLATAASTLGKSVDSEALYSDENIMETFRGINTQYKYYNDMPFNMKEFLGFEGIGGWLGTEASRKKLMELVDSEVAKLASQTVYDPTKETNRKVTKKGLMETEQKKKIAASKAALVLCLYVFCYLNYMPIPKGNMDEDTINRMIQTLNKYYEQINTFSVGGTPKEVDILLDKYVENFTANLGQLKKEMEKKTAKPIVGGMISVRNPSRANLKNPLLSGKHDSSLNEELIAKPVGANAGLEKLMETVQSGSEQARNETVSETTRGTAGTTTGAAGDGGAGATTGAAGDGREVVSEGGTGNTKPLQSTFTVMGSQVNAQTAAQADKNSLKKFNEKVKITKEVGKEAARIENQAKEYSHKMETI